MSAPHNHEPGAEPRGPTWDLRLYVTAGAPKCVAAIDNLQRACERYLEGRYRLEIVDLLANPRRAADDQVVAVPTLVRRLPEPPGRVVGDLSDTPRLLAGLQIALRPGEAT
ncbi:MAG: circadian clock KaiB family protein [Solirubrobacteraceae bacterium]|jgi:circadian clock protein KaiB